MGAEISIFAQTVKNTLEMQSDLASGAPSCPQIGPKLALSWLKLAQVGLRLALLGASGAASGLLGRSWPLWSCSWGGPGRLLVRSWRLLGRSWTDLGPSRPPWARSWDLLDLFWALLARSGNLLASQKTRGAGFRRLGRGCGLHGSSVSSRVAAASSCEHLCVDSVDGLGPGSSSGSRLSPPVDARECGADDGWTPGDCRSRDCNRIDLGSLALQAFDGLGGSLCRGIDFSTNLDASS